MCRLSEEMRVKYPADGLTKAEFLSKFCVDDVHAPKNAIWHRLFHIIDLDRSGELEKMEGSIGFIQYV